ncbi:MAG: hypothetical protein UHD64_02510 [Bacteroidales bacterium]|nr:hypothetical protein [Bacteroidales bacterium]
MGKKERIIVVKGTDRACRVYDVVCLIRMLTNRKEIDYLPISASVHMIQYKATDKQQREIVQLFQNECSELEIGYLVETKKEARAK